MTARQHRTMIGLLCLLAALAVSLALSSLHDLGMGAAHAQGAAPPDPLGQPADTLSLMQKLYHSGAYVSIAILGAFYLLRLAGLHQWKPNITHWLAIAGGIVALFVPSALQGTTPNAAMLVGFIVPALALVAPGLLPQPPKQAQGGFVRMQLVALIALVGILFGACSWFKKEAKTVENDVVDCAAGDLVNLISIAAEVAAGLLMGSISWTAIESSALAQGETIGGCFLADVQAHVAAAAAAGSGSATASPAMVDAAHRTVIEGARALDDFRATIKSKKHYKTADGVVR